MRVAEDEPDIWPHADVQTLYNEIIIRILLRRVGGRLLADENLERVLRSLDPQPTVPIQNSPGLPEPEQKFTVLWYHPGDISPIHAMHANGPPSECTDSLLEVQRNVTATYGHVALDLKFKFALGQAKT